MRITNNSDISLILAVWLIHDEYDYIDKLNYISVTTLMRPLKQIILPSRIPPEEHEADVEEFIARALGTAIHDSIEKAWVRGFSRSLKLMGYSDAVIERIRINPSDEELKAAPNAIPVYLEQRGFKEIEVDGVKYTIGGKFDVVAEGMVQDNKSSSAYSWLFGTRDDQHRQQGSLYRWINPDKITQDIMKVNYIFTDWSKMQARTNPKYPQKRVEHKDISLLTVEDTEAWVTAKLRQIAKYSKLSESEMPECTDEELWRSEPQYKYYSDPTKTDGRSTKNFDSLAEANKFKAEKGGKGVVITKPGEVKACGYCPAFDGCKQKDQYLV